MTAPDNFVSRWARRKREAECARKCEPEAEGLRLEPPALPDGGPTFAPHGTDRAADEAFDQATLPSIETITFDTDIRAFLDSRVSAELTRAALRRAWVSDPAIRDFIGIAENQWDFNVPNAMPGFGPLLESDNLPGLLASAIGGPDNLAGTSVEAPLSGERALSVAADHESTDPDRSAKRTLDRAPAVDPHIGGPAADGHGEDSAIGDDRAAEGNDSLPSRRPHGSALPRFEV